MTSNKHIHLKNTGICAVFFAGVMVFGACTGQQKQESRHYFLKGYDHLEFRDNNNARVPVSAFITAANINGTRAYHVLDTTLLLIHSKTQKPYSGYIRTFHKNRYNLQAEFEAGKITRLRYWYPNRSLGMDANYHEESGTIWKQSGEIAVNWNQEETYYMDPGTQTIRQIIADSLTSYYNREGELTRYTIRSDSSITQFYADGSPRFKFPITPGGIRDGEVRRWYANGQLQVTGQYKNGRQHGIWIEYDSLGNEIKRESWD